MASPILTIRRGPDLKPRKRRGPPSPETNRKRGISLSKAWEEGRPGWHKHARLIVECACGCGQCLVNRDDHGRLRRYRNGHGGAALPGDRSPHWRGGISRKFKRLRTKVWRNLRRLLIARDGHCILCATGADLTIHHIKAYRDGGRDGLNNLVVLCRPCHGRQERFYGTLRYAWDTYSLGGLTVDA